MKVKQILDRLEEHIEAFENNKDLNSARKAAEAICKIILLSSENNTAIEKASEGTLNALIDGISVKTTGAKAFHIKKLKIELTTIRDYCNEGSHDNDTTLSEDDYKRVQISINNLISYTFDAKEENLIIDEELPEKIYIKINNKKQSPEDWRCEKIISVVYPNRKIENLLSNKECELYKVSDINKFSIGFAFLKRNISIKKALEDIKQRLEKSEKLDTLTFLFPKEISKHTGNAVKGRKDYIKRTANPFTEDLSKNKLSFEFIEDYIWDNCLSEEMKEPSNQSNEPFFIDQKLHTSDGKSFFSLEFIDLITKRKNEQKKPIYLVIGDGGAGKTTFCNEAIKKIDSFLTQGMKKKAILISSFDVPEELKNSESTIQSIQDLYQSTLSDNEDQIDYKSLLLNISSGNILIIIDGLDEIESKLKDKFSPEEFINSLIELNDTYNNCTVIITSRPTKREISNSDEIEELKLLGFDNELIDKYLSKRFKEDPKKLQAAKNYLNDINSSEQATTPLILRLISDLIEDELDELESGSTEYFILKNSLDKVIAQIIKREIKKQTLKISIDQYFKILSDIVFDYNNLISEPELEELIELHFIDSSTEPTADNFKKVKISPLLSNHRDKYKLKHDALILWIKSRELINKINKDQQENNRGVLRCIQKELYKGGPLADEIIQHKNNQGNYEKNLISASTRRLSEAGLSSQEKLIERKLISAAIRLNITNNGEKSLNTERLKDLFSSASDDLRYISIFGDFPPLDLSEQKVHFGHFEDYKNFGKCKFSEKTTFQNCTFIKIDTSPLGKSTLSSKNFIHCNLCETLEQHLSTQTENVEKRTENIKADLIKILKTGYRSNSFNWKSEKVYRQQCATLNIKTPLTRTLDKLCDLGLLTKESEKASSEVGYRVPTEKSHSVAKLITDDFVDKDIRAAIKEFMEH